MSSRRFFIKKISLLCIFFLIAISSGCRLNVNNNESSLSSSSYWSTNIITITNFYTVKYNGNGSTSGSVPVDSNTYIPGQAVSIPGNPGNLGKTGFVFSGWNTLPDGSGITFTGWQSFPMGFSNVILYALWGSYQSSPQFGTNGTAEPCLVLSSPQEYNVTISVVVSNAGLNFSNMNSLYLIFLPVPQSNPYQIISNYQCGSGQVLPIPDSLDYYDLFCLSNLPAPGNTVTVSESFSVTLYNSIQFDCSNVSNIYPYDTNSDVYRMNTGPNGAYIDPSNSIIQAISSNIWSNSTNILDYANQCLWYVGTNFRYTYDRGPETLADVLSNGGGDCGGLMVIYVSLLRCKNIPSRPLVGMCPSGSGHGYADFYLEGYGWVPVDPTQICLFPNVTGYNNNIFGKGDALIIFSETYNAILNCGQYQFTSVGLQCYSCNWLLWVLYGSYGGGTITSSYTLSTNNIDSSLSLTDLKKYYQIKVSKGGHTYK